MEITRRELVDLKDRKFPQKISFKPIGVIHSPFKTLKGIPIQSSMSNIQGSIEIFTPYHDGLKDLEGFSHIYCLFFFDMVKLPIPLQSKPFLTNKIKGVFAIRTPFRPNPIGLSILEILEIKANEIFVDNIDILDETPVLDIKPYIQQFDAKNTYKIGWLEGRIERKTS